MIKLNVTKKDINKAQKLRKTLGEEVFNYYTCCPVAMAIKRTQKKKVSVSPPNEVIIGSLMYTASSDKDGKKLSTVISRFDSMKRVRPTTFFIQRNCL